MNPFLSHWVEVIRDWEKTFGRDPHDSKQQATSTTAIRNVDLDIFSTRVQLVRGILAGEGVKVPIGPPPRQINPMLTKTHK
jgi:hypothetical protein